MRKRIFKPFACLLLMVTMIADCLAVETLSDPLEELKLAVENIRKETNAPAFGIAIVDKNGPVWVTGLGLASIEKNTAANADTMFRIGSVSKVFSSIAIMQLVETGKLSLNDKLRDLVPDLEFVNPWHETHPVRIAHLLEHTTGWDFHIAEYLKEAPDSTRLKDGLANHPDSRVSRWAPGTRHAYSNLGPVVAAYVVEKITGFEFEQYVQANIFDPLNMTSSSYFKTEEYLKRGATNYTEKGTADYAQIYGRPSSSINSTAKDMAQFLSLFINRGTVNGQTLLSKESITRMERGQTTLGAEQGIDAGYGLTLQTRGYQDWHTPFYGHGGFIPGAITDFVYLPETQSGYVFMINDINGEAHSRLSARLRKYILKDLTKPQIEAAPLPKKFSNIDGYYIQINPGGSLVKITSELNNLVELTVSDNGLHQRYLIGGWKETYLANRQGELVSDWTGLPVVALVDDPVEGEAVQIEGSLYKKTSAVAVFGRLILLALSALLFVSSLLFAVLWVPRKLFGKSGSVTNISLRSWPLVASLTLVVVVFIPLMSGDFIQMVSRFPVIGISIFVLTLLYPLLSLISMGNLIKLRNTPFHKGVYWHSVTVTGAHLFLAVYFASYGLLPFNIWS
jgi:CubicO group peptidase (beta-lactamase class C family)